MYRIYFLHVLLATPNYPSETLLSRVSILVGDGDDDSDDVNHGDDDIHWSLIFSSRSSSSKTLFRFVSFRMCEAVGFRFVSLRMCEAVQGC